MMIFMQSVKWRVDMSKLLSYIYSGWVPCTITVNGGSINGVAINKGRYIVFNDMNGVTYRIVK